MKFKMKQRLAAAVFEADEEGRLQEKYESVDADVLHPLVLAYVGDAYFHLFVRTRLLSFTHSQVDILNRFGAKIVSAVWQARAYEAIEPMLTEEENEIFRRGRNAHSRTPRASTVREYHISTGFEALLGMLFLKKENGRLREISEAAFQAIAGQMMKG
ncbi:MAG: ribonuclease III [Schwartzia sp.]|nr:ribonuclease III [Schwartzia sp. (in: firmicutes)]